MHHVQDIPGSIVVAICKVQASLDAVAKTQRNGHGGYQFASTDDIYAALTRRLGEVGLAILPLELEHDIVRVEKDGKTVQWLKASYGFVLATEQATWTHPTAKRSLFIQVTGPQSHQAAQSYAEKAFLRSLFKLPTGDVDLDSMPQAEFEEGQVSLAGNGRKPRKSSAEGKRDGSVKQFNQLRADIQSAISPEHLIHLREIHSGEEGDWAEMPSQWRNMLQDDYEVKMSEFDAHRDAAE